MKNLTTVQTITVPLTICAPIVLAFTYVSCGLVAATLLAVLLAVLVWHMNAPGPVPVFAYRQDSTPTRNVSAEIAAVAEEDCGPIPPYVAPEVPLNITSEESLLGVSANNPTVPAVKYRERKRKVRVKEETMIKALCSPVTSIDREKYTIKEPTWIDLTGLVVHDKGVIYRDATQEDVLNGTKLYSYHKHGTVTPLEKT